MHALAPGDHGEAFKPELGEPLAHFPAPLVSPRSKPKPRPGRGRTPSARAASTSIGHARPSRGTRSSPSGRRREYLPHPRDRGSRSVSPFFSLIGDLVDMRAQAARIVLLEKALAFAVPSGQRTRLHRAAPAMNPASAAPSARNSRPVRPWCRPASGKHHPLAAGYPISRLAAVSFGDAPSFASSIGCSILQPPNPQLHAGSRWTRLCRLRHGCGAMWQLHQFPLCPFSRKVRLLLGEKGVAFELVRENPWEGRDAFFAHQPCRPHAGAARPGARASR